MRVKGSVMAAALAAMTLVGANAAAQQGTTASQDTTHLPRGTTVAKKTGQAVAKGAKDTGKELHRAEVHTRKQVKRTAKHLKRTGQKVGDKLTPADTGTGRRP